MHEILVFDWLYVNDGCGVSIDDNKLDVVQKRIPLMYHEGMNQ